MKDRRDCGAGTRWAFLFAGMPQDQREGTDFALPALAKTRRARVSAVCALVIVCGLAPSAIVSQTASGDDAAKKPSSKPAHKTTSATTHTASTKRSSRKKKSTKLRGQQKIDSERAQAIQEALIREHYLSGEASGTWNQASEDAMRRFQADNGWQSKTVPDSRALIKLGLGPSKDHLLNPESAMTTVPDPPKAESMPTTSNSPATVADPPAPSTPGSTNSSSPQ